MLRLLKLLFSVRVFLYVCVYVRERVCFCICACLCVYLLQLPGRCALPEGKRVVSS